MKKIEMPYDVFFDGPEYYECKFDFYSCGSSPNLLKHLLKYLDKNADSLAEINIALYLFNNKLLNEKLVALSEKGITVNVYTIPIEGYDAENPKDIIDIETRLVFSNQTKYEVAKDIFEKHFYNRYKNYKLYFFPHMYLRSPNLKTFSRGNMPYSLHTKSFLFRHKNGSCDMAMSSSNFAVRDLVKEENLFFIYNEKEHEEAALDFFVSLNKYSIHISEFEFKHDYSNYYIEAKDCGLKEDGGFMAPFYRNSSLKIESVLKEMIEAANERIIIVGQHVCPINYSVSNNERTGLAASIVEKAKQNVPVDILSQTFASGNSKFDSKFRKPANQKNFKKFFNEIKTCANINYFVNENCHSKYIIIDSSVFISTFNYTPTQFIYLENVAIENFINNPGKSYRGIYSEVGQFVVIKDKNIVEKYVSNFNDIISNKETEKVK